MKKIECDHIILRDLIEGDIKDRLRWESEETEWQQWDAPWECEGLNSKQKAHELQLVKTMLESNLLRLKNKKDDDIRYSFQIVSKEDKKHIGWVSSYNIDDNYFYSEEENHLAIGIDIPDLSARGKGYGKEALVAFIQYLYSQNVKEIYTQTWSGNYRMISLAQKLGFVLVCRKKDFREVNGQKYDGLTFLHKDSLLVETDDFIVRPCSALDVDDLYQYQLKLRNESCDYLKYINYPIKQLVDGFKVNSDTVILGMFMDKLFNKTVLDIGTNTAALLLYAHYHKAGKLIGVDINQDALKLAKENLSNYTNSFELYNCKVQDLEIEPVDVIVCNPPFFKEGTKKKQDISNAMFDDCLSIDELFTSIRRLMKHNGTAYLIYQAERFPELYQSCINHKLKIMKMRFVHDEKNKNASRVLVKLKVGPMNKLNVEKPVYIRKGVIEMDEITEMEKFFEN